MLIKILLRYWQRKFVNFVFPLTRRIFPSAFANKLVAIQPMTSPKSQVFLKAPIVCEETK